MPPSVSVDQAALTVSLPGLLHEGSDARFRAMLHNLLAFAARLEQVRGRFGAMVGLSGSQYTVLISIRHLQVKAGGVGIKAIADHLSLSGAFVTSETNKLIKLELVTKRPNPEDARRVLLSITPKAAQLLDGLAPVQREINDVLFEPLDGLDMALVCRLAEGLRHSSERALMLTDYLSQAEEPGQ
ncbi:MarR family winged helix-turn-helix transcriptional regulator [Alkalilacustris brevis]|uniref:MarR family winged helix-turn-helix transcriptional regulator n=1 Tax=Alkalilacustris brevis TaxID=2026338 RepID=UPI0013906ADD|nr:MarR family transcriptional regulator [Alkalilacustris brevis]